MSHHYSNAYQIPSGSHVSREPPVAGYTSPNLTTMPNSQSRAYAPTSSCDMPTAPAMRFSSSTDSNSSTRTASSTSSSRQYMSQPLSAYPDPSYQSQRQRSSSRASQDYGGGHAALSQSPPRTMRGENLERSGSRYVCMMSGCSSSFSRSADLNRHYTTVHFPDPTRLDCPKPRCTRKGNEGFTRQDHLNEHLRQYHGDNIPKRTSSKSSRPSHYVR
ncbi:hypothetical protein AJ80_09719 [Polytolypa hystricis UAMH7299]|uniref:C2H2-type domain-containing protein n=1 Tax=Polytolypa hystricis (strain UAMH7299) TaxID=1447883 RepID=A0A2B7WLD7_POLH7|nr:hypothetical protein AJ80_09719 [Polytolypa hystricis UAMH7299]